MANGTVPDGKLVVLSQESRSTTPWLTTASLCASTCLLCWVVLNGFGIPFLVLVLGSLIGLTVLTHRAIQESSFSLMLWFISMAGIRNMTVVKMPGLPDFSFDRAFLIWILLMFLIRALFRGEKLRQPYLADIFVLLHTLYVLVNLYFNDPRHFHYWVLSEAGPAVAFFYGKNLLKKDAEIRNLIYFFLALVVYFYWTSIAQHFNWNNLVWPKYILDTDRGLYQTGRVGGPFNHPPMFGQMLGMLSLVHIFLLLRAKRTFPKILLFLSFSGSLVGSLVTYTRGPWLATFLSLLVMAGINHKYRRFLGALAIICLLVGILGLYQLANTDFFQERLYNLDTVENRIGFLANAMRMVRDHPFFGVGYFRFNDFREQYNQTTTLPLYGTIKRHMAAQTPIHDIYLGRLAEEGIVGLGLMMGFYVIILNAFIRRWREGFWTKWMDRNMLTLIAGMMVNFIIGGMVIDYRYFGLVNVLFFFFAGLIYGFHPEITDPQYRKFHGKEEETGEAR